MERSTTEAFALHKSEYASLRTEILAWQAERSQTETWSAAGILAIYAWLATHPAQGWFLILHTVGWWIPVGTALYCRRRITNISLGIRQAGGYLADLQNRYADPDLQGWEARLRNTRASGKALARQTDARPGELDLISTPAGKLWTIVVYITLVVAIGVTVTITAINLPDTL